MATKPTGAPFAGPPPKYLNDFSKALASEVRILLQEVGKLRDERRQLQHEIAELMAVKSKHSAGGEYSPDWMAQYPMVEAPPPDAHPPGPPQPEEPLQPARPGWRVVSKRPEYVPGARRKARAAAAAPAPPPPPPEPPRPEMPSWAQWRPNPLLAPAVRDAPSQALVSPPPRTGLFGPVTPPPQ